MRGFWVNLGPLKSVGWLGGVLSWHTDGQHSWKELRNWTLLAGFKSDLSLCLTFTHLQNEVWPGDIPNYILSSSLSLGEETEVQKW